jgi:hypothetical protein
MTIASKSGGLIIKDGRIAENCECCDCGPCSLFSTVSGNGLGWSVTEQNLPRTLPISVSFTFIDSSNCNNFGSSDRQRGIADCCFTLAEQTTVFVSVSGNVERQNAGFDISRVLINGNQRALIGGQNLNAQCSMEFRSDSGSLVLPAGTHRYVFEADTIDGLFHTDMVHLFEINAIP